MNKKKSFFAILLSFALIISICPSLNANAATKSNQTEDDIKTINNWFYDDARDNVTVNSAANLVKELIGDDKIDVANNILVEGNITLNKSALTKNGIDESFSRKGWTNSSITGIYMSLDSILVKNGATLTIDGVIIDAFQGGMGNYLCINVQKGGALKIINSGEIRNIALIINEGGKLDIDEGRYEGNDFQNYGTVNLDAKAYQKNNKEYHFYPVEIQTKDNTGRFVNGSKGVINVKYGYLRINATAQWTDDSFVDDYSMAAYRNYGTINCTDKGGLQVCSSSSQYQSYRPYLLPFINHGKINVTHDKPISNYVGSPLAIEYASFLNKGKIDIVRKKITPATYNSYQNNAGSIAEASVYSSASASMKLYEAKLVNEGTISVYAKEGLGVDTYGKYYTPESYDSSFYGVTKSNKAIETQIINEKGATIDLKSDLNGVALSLDSENTIVNRGTIKISTTDNKTKINNADIIIGGKIDNKGTINNSGRIGYANFNKKPDGITGNKVTGKGTEAYYYSIYYKAKNDKSGNTIYIPKDAKVTYSVGGKTVGTQTVPAAMSSVSFCTFLDKGTSATIKAKVQAYGTQSVKVSAAKNFAAYKSAKKTYFEKVIPTKLTNLPAAVVTKSANSKAKTVTLTYKKVSGAKGYEIRYGNNYSAYNYDKDYWGKVLTTTKTTVNLTGFKKGDTAYIYVCPYKVVDKIKVYSSPYEPIQVVINK